MKQLTYLEVLEDTVKFYSEDTSRRALDENGSCLYTNKENNHCGVGRCLTDKALKVLGDSTIGVRYLLYVEQDGLLESLRGLSPGLHNLKEEYRHLSDRRFWNAIQQFHDNSDYWNIEGLTEKGQNKVEIIKEQIKNFLNK